MSMLGGVGSRRDAPWENGVLGRAGGRPRLSVWSAAGLLVIAAFLVRLLFLALGPGLDLPAERLWGDAPDFHRIAVNLADGNGFAMRWPGAGGGDVRPTAFRAPGLPAVLAGVYTLAGPSPTVARLVLVGFDALSVGVLALLGWTLVSWRTGIAAGAVAAVYPPLWVHVETLWSEPLFTFLLLLVVASAEWSRRRPSVRSAAVLGLAVGAAGLVRANGLFLLLPLALWLAWLVRDQGWRHVSRLVGACVLAALLAILPWEVRTITTLDTPVFVNTQGGSVIAGEYTERTADPSDPIWGHWDAEVALKALYAAPDEGTFASTLRDRGLTWIREHPREALVATGLRTVRHFDLYWQLDNRTLVTAPTTNDALNAASVVSWWLVAAFGIVGLVRLRQKGALGPFAPALLVWATLTASGVLLAGLTRYRVPSDPVVILLAATLLTTGLRRSTRTGAQAPGEAAESAANPSC